MNQQDRILKLAQEQIQIVGTSGARFGKTYKAAFELAIRFTLENLWISVAKELPELVNEGTFSKWSDDVLVRLDDGQVRQSGFWQDKEPHGPYVSKGWFYIGREQIKITHWMPIPELKEGGEK